MRSFFYNNEVHDMSMSPSPHLPSTLSKKDHLNTKSADTAIRLFDLGPEQNEEAKGYSPTLYSFSGELNPVRIITTSTPSRSWGAARTYLRCAGFDEREPARMRYM
jgi:hypothetical protein